MSHSPGQAAAENIERFLAEWPEPNHQGVVSRATPSIRLTTHDLRTVLAELAEYKRAVSAIYDIAPQQRYSAQYNEAFDDGVKAAQVRLAEHITGLEV